MSSKTESAGALRKGEDGYFYQPNIFALYAEMSRLWKKHKRACHARYAPPERAMETYRAFRKLELELHRRTGVKP